MSSDIHRPNTLTIETKSDSIDESKLIVNEFQDEEEVALNACLDALLYQDGSCKHLTHSTLRVIEDAKPRLTEANALFIEGVLVLTKYGDPFRLFSEAEMKGCQHPLLYEYIARRYISRDSGVRKVEVNFFKYTDMAIAGGWFMSDDRDYRLYGPRKRDTKAFHHLLDLEREGHIDGQLFGYLGASYDNRYINDPLLAKMYYQRSIECGYLPARDIFVNWDINNQAGIEGAILLLLEAENKGLGLKDDRILDTLVDFLSTSNKSYTFSSQVLGPFKDKDEMALHYCNLSRQRGSPCAYSRLVNTYTLGKYGRRQDIPRAMAILEEAVQVGACTDEICLTFLKRYLDGQSGPPNGLKVLEYGEKGLEIAAGDKCGANMIQFMAEVYMKGIYPVKQDGRKAVELYERGLRTFPEARQQLYRGLSNIYSQGIYPIIQNGAKVLEYRIMALDYFEYAYDSDLYEIYDGLADVYQRGIYPIAQNEDLASEMDNIAKYQAWLRLRDSEW